jgi:isoquinoline 1-oxidoreductase beta subunit
MTGFMHEREFSRKSFLKGTGGAVLGASLVGAGLAGKANAAFVPSPGTYNPPTNAVDSFLYVNPDNTVSLLTSQVEIGNGTPTGFLMIAAEELDLDMGQMRYGSSVYDSGGTLIATITDGWRAVNTGGHGGSRAIQSVGPLVRAAAATISSPVVMPLPGSMWLVFSSTVLSGWIVSQESTWARSGLYAALAAEAPRPAPAIEKPTTIAPPPFRKLLRENSRSCMKPVTSTHHPSPSRQRPA